MKSKNMTTSVCPRCGKTYTGRPAMSRDNAEMVCPDCGTREALASIHIEENEQEKILEIIHRYHNED